MFKGLVLVLAVALTSGCGSITVKEPQFRGELMDQLPPWHGS